MELWQLAIPVEGDDDRRRLLALLLELQVPMDPCAGDPRFETDREGRHRLLVIATARVRQQLEDAQRNFEVVRDFAEVPDPRTYVSRKDRFAEELARLRATKPRR